jgi:hypothetical protein
MLWDAYAPGTPMQLPPLPAPDVDPLALPITPEQLEFASLLVHMGRELESLGNRLSNGHADREFDERFNRVYAAANLHGLYKTRTELREVQQHLDNELQAIDFFRRFDLDDGNGLRLSLRYDSAASLTRTLARFHRRAAVAARRLADVHERLALDEANSAEARLRWSRRGWRRNEEPPHLPQTSSFLGGI